MDAGCRLGGRRCASSRRRSVLVDRRSLGSHCWVRRPSRGSSGVHLARPSSLATRRTCHLRWDDMAASARSMRPPPPMRRAHEQIRAANRIAPRLESLVDGTELVLSITETWPSPADPLAHVSVFSGARSPRRRTRRGEPEPRVIFSERAINSPVAGAVANPTSPSMIGMPRGRTTCYVRASRRGPARILVSQPHVSEATAAAPASAR